MLQRFVTVRRLTFEKGDHVYELEDPSHSIFLVRSGRVALVTTYPETGEGVDEAFGPGKVFGEVEIVDGRNRTATAKAVARSIVLEIDRKELMDILFNKPEDSLVLSKSSYDRLKELYSDDSLDSDMARLREEMQLSIRDAVVAHESRVVKSHNGMAAIAVPIILMVALAVGAYWFFHRA